MTPTHESHLVRAIRSLASYINTTTGAYTVDFDAYVGRLTAEQTKDLLMTLIATMDDNALMDTLTNTLSANTKEELAARWES